MRRAPTYNFLFVFSCCLLFNYHLYIHLKFCGTPPHFLQCPTSNFAVPQILRHPPHFLRWLSGIIDVNFLHWSINSKFALYATLRTLSLTYSRFVISFFSVRLFKIAITVFCALMFAKLCIYVNDPVNSLSPSCENE